MTPQPSSGHNRVCGQRDVKFETGCKQRHNEKMRRAEREPPAGSICRSASRQDQGDETSNITLQDFSTITKAFGAAVASSVDFEVSSGDTRSTIRHWRSPQGLWDGERFLGAGTGDPKSVAIAGALKTVTITGVDADVKITGNLPGELLSQMLR